MRMTMERSAKVSGRRPMAAMALGHQVEKREIDTVESCLLRVESGQGDGACGKGEERTT